MTGWEIASPALYHCEPAWKWSRAEPLEDFDFWMVLQGRGGLTVGRETHELEPGRWFLLQPGDHPEAWHDPRHPLVVFACHFQTDRPGRLAGSVIEGVCQKSLRHEAEQAAQAFHEGATGRALAAAILRRIILQVFHAQTRPAESGRKHRLDVLAREIRSSPGRAWTVATMAREAGLSIPHLNRLWRAAWGMAPGQFIIRQKVQRAILLLRESDLTIQQIADSLGYHDVFFFHRQFRTVAGATPRAVRLGAESLVE